MFPFQEAQIKKKKNPTDISLKAQGQYKGYPFSFV